MAMREACDHYSTVKDVKRFRIEVYEVDQDKPAHVILSRRRLGAVLVAYTSLSPRGVAYLKTAIGRATNPPGTELDADGLPKAEAEPVDTAPTDRGAGH